MIVADEAAHEALEDGETDFDRPDKDPFKSHAKKAVDYHSHSHGPPPPHMKDMYIWDQLEQSESGSSVSADAGSGNFQFQHPDDLQGTHGPLA